MVWFAGILFIGCALPMWAQSMLYYKRFQTQKDDQYVSIVVMTALLAIVFFVGGCKFLIPLIFPKIAHFPRLLVSGILTLSQYCFFIPNGMKYYRDWQKTKSIYSLLISGACLFSFVFALVILKQYLPNF